MTTRRGFLQACLAAAAAPAIVKVGSIMTLRPVDSYVAAPDIDKMRLKLQLSSEYGKFGVGHLYADYAQQLGERMALTRELIAHRVLVRG